MSTPNSPKTIKGLQELKISIISELNDKSVLNSS